jgi:hypothetical protein
VQVRILLVGVLLARVALVATAGPAAGRPRETEAPSATVAASTGSLALDVLEVVQQGTFGPCPGGKHH